MIFPKEKKIWAWASYDFADTVYSALFVTFFFPILIRTYLGGTELQVGLVFGLALSLAAIVVPVLGAASDATGRRTPILLFTTIVTVIAVLSVGFVGLIPALILGFIGHVFSIADIDLYDSKISDVAQESEYGRVSGFGVGLGYLGTIVSLLMAYIIMSFMGWESEEAVRAIFPAAAIFYAVFSIPLFLWVPDKQKTKIPFIKGVKKGVNAIKRVLFSKKSIEGVRPFLLASFVYNDAMHTSIIFLSLFGTVYIGLSIEQFFPVFAVMAFFAMVGSLIAGHISDKWGPKNLLTAALFIWIGVIILLLMASGFISFLVAGSIGGVALGTVWTANRHMVTNLTPRKHLGTVFGVEGLTEKMSGLVGPITYGALATFFGYQTALWFLLFLFIVGLVLLQRVPRDRATRLIK